MSQIERISSLSDKLMEIRKMKDLDVTGEPLAWTTSMNLIETIDSFKKIDGIINSIEAVTGEENLNDAVHAIGEELRHAMYHIELLNYFSYLKE